jgi:uncharacterized protein YbaA (DUF1428 family)
MGLASTPRWSKRKGDSKRSRSMTYIQGFVAAVPAANKNGYREHAARATPIFKDFGATRIVEAWGDDVPDGKVTDFKRAVNAQSDEVVVFGWWEFPSKAARDSANEKMMKDPRMQQFGADMPFDGKRMIFGGFQSIVDETGNGTPGYADGYIVPVPTGNKEAYRALAAKAAIIFKEYGATRVVEAWGDDIPDGKVTDFKRAVKATAGESIVFSFVEWPDRATRDEGMKQAMKDPRMQPDGDMPFDGQRMVWGGFAPLLDE